MPAGMLNMPVIRIVYSKLLPVYPEKGSYATFSESVFSCGKLDVSIYQELIEKPRLWNQSLIVVFIYSMTSAYGTFGRTGVTGINIGMVTSLLGWLQPQLLASNRR